MTGLPTVALRKSLASPLTTLGNRRWFAGRSLRWASEIMSMVAPAGPMYQAGTLSGNPLAMTAGIKTLELLQKPGTYEYLILLKKLADGLLQIAKELVMAPVAVKSAVCSASSPQGQSITTRMPRRRTYLSSAAFIAVC